MQRDSDLHGPRTDDELKRELREAMQGSGPDNVEDWVDPEAPADEPIGEVGDQPGDRPNG